MWLRFSIEIEEHDHIEEEHHNGARVNDDVHDSQELRVEEHVVTSDAKECYNKIEDAVNRVARHNDHNCCQYGQEGEEVEEVKRHVTYYGLAACSV